MTQSIQWRIGLDLVTFSSEFPEKLLTTRRNAASRQRVACDKESVAIKNRVKVSSARGVFRGQRVSAIVPISWFRVRTSDAPTRCFVHRAILSVVSIVRAGQPRPWSRLARPRRGNVSAIYASTTPRKTQLRH